MNALRAPQPSKSFTRIQVLDALEACGNDERASDSDIRRLTDLLIHMSTHDIVTVDDETCGDSTTLQLLDYLVPTPQ
ncbi:hypothetical protein ACSFA0_24845 [Variovorax sp. LT1P1]|uniref:hypothetical protein n=1 Tax=Variovorax sp. LT1P1 TaxID=3443730 RepID=UPI003F45F4A4